MDTKIKKRYNFDYSEKKVLDFEKQLSDCDIIICNDSDLYRIGFYVLEVLEKSKNPKLHSNKEDLRPVMRDVMGFNNFIEKLSPLLQTEYKNEIIPHLRLLNSSSIPQNTKSKVTDQGANKLFELYVASLCYPQFNNIKLDSPDNSKGDNPDVMFNYKGLKWGIACKVIHSFKSKTIIDNVIKGIEQIENSECDTGLVFLNLKNIIDHDRIWPITNYEEVQENSKVEPLFGSFTSYKFPVKLLEEYVLQMQVLLLNEIGLKELLNIFKNKKAQPMIYSLLQSSTAIMENGSPTFSFISYLGKSVVDNVSNDTINIMNLFEDKIK